MLTVQQLKKHYNTEQITLVLLARLYFNTVTHTEVAEVIVKNNIDWTLLYKITRAHGLRSLVYYITRHHNIAIPKEFEERLKKSYNKTRRQNLTMAIATSKLMADFEKEGIAIIPYKGSVFAHHYYPDIALRESTDVDFLVSVNHVTAIEDHFIGKNYTAKTTVARAYLTYYKKHFKDIVYRTPSGKNAFSIEMHWRLMEKFSGNFPGYDFFINQTEPYNMSGLKLCKLSPTYDMLAVVSNHFVKDMGIKFKYLVDIASLINKDKHQLNEQVIFETAAKYGFKKRLDTGLALTESLLGVKLNSAKPNNGHLKYLSVPLAFPIQLPRLYINEPAYIKRSLQLQDSNSHRLIFILKTIKYMFLPTYEDINGLKSPSGNVPLLVITRPFRIIYRVIKRKMGKQKAL